MTRKTALQTVERHSWGGSYFDSLTHAAMFRKYKPHNFGVKAAQQFSSQLGSHLINKKFTYYTVAKNNVYLLPGGVDDYEWFLVADADVDFRATELLVSTSSYPGKGGMPFKIALDRDWLHEPVIIKSESQKLPLMRILGYPVQRGSNSWEYEVELQTGDKNAYIPVSYLEPGRRFIDATTSVSDELNQKFAGDQFGEMFKLQSWTGNFARKCEFTDKLIRTEIACRKEGRKMPKGQGYTIGGKTYMDGAVGVGYLYKQKFNLTNSGEADTIEAGVFITKAEARLEDRLMQDREMNFEFGQLEKTVDRDSQRTMKVAPGWKQMVRDGHFKIHNGTMTLSELNEYVAEIFLTRRTHSDRKIVLASGEAGVEFLHRLIAAEASQFQYIDTLFTQKRNDPQGYHDNELEYGSQFTRIKLPMGYIIEIAYDPIKDDRKLFPEKAPGTNRTLESFAFDIFDFGATDQKAFDAGRPENITAVMQDGVEGYWTVSNVYDFETGVEKSGGNVYGNNKELGIYRETSGGLCIWDITRVVRIEYAPFQIV
jgi:hypothetical protein